MRPLMHLTGMPATGKSSYGRWLEATKGFLHVDPENERPEHAGLVDIWFGICRSTHSVAAMDQAAVRPVALDWGFPPHMYPWVQAAKAAGVRILWFNGDQVA